MPRRTAGTCFDCLTKDALVLYKIEKAWVCPTCAESRLETLSQIRDEIADQIVRVEARLHLPLTGPLDHYNEGSRDGGAA
jgi:hypothetical protein